MRATLLRTTLAALCVAGLAVTIAKAGLITTTTDNFGSGANAFTIQFATIGNAGNGNDATGENYTADGGLYGSGSTFGLGGVSYQYRMGVTEIAQDWVTKAGTPQLSVAWGASQPAAYITWYEAAAFVNWLNTSTGHQAAYQLNGTNTALTLWTSGQAWQAEGENLYRHKDAYYFLPSESEWYKAAYHKNDGVTANFWDYATGSNTAPTPVASGTGAGTAVHGGQQDSAPADVSTAGGLSPYGTRGQNGNVFEWLESASAIGDDEPRVIRGGSWNSFIYTSSGRSTRHPVDIGDFIGFRVASIEPIPEPGTALVGVLLLGVATARRRRRSSAGLEQTRKGVRFVSGCQHRAMKAKRLRTTLGALCLTGLAVTTAPAAVMIDYVPVGNAGNPPIDAMTTYGGVNYDYNIGKYEVTLTQYTAFLNAVAATDTNALYNGNMGTNLNIAGITRSGISGAYSYAVAGDGQRPVTYVSMLDAMRFANWVGNGQPTGAQNASTTEDGAYTMALGGLAPRNVGAAVVVASENEWYKAAYYQPAAAGGDVDGYWLYPTQSNSAPGNAIGALANQANYYDGDFSVTQITDYSPTQNYLTAVGAYSNSASYYGTFDQGGNVMELNEAVIGSNRGLRGGSWFIHASTTHSDYRASVDPSFETYLVGFRLASVPEPTGIVTGLMLLGVATARRRRR